MLETKETLVGRALGRGAGRHGNPLQYSCLQNPMDRGAWWAPGEKCNFSKVKVKQIHHGVRIGSSLQHSYLWVFLFCFDYKEDLSFNLFWVVKYYA